MNQAAGKFLDYRVIWKWLLGALLWAAPILFLLIFYFYPLSRILATSLARSEQGWFGPLQEALSSAHIRRVVVFTFWQAGLSTGLTLLIGLPGAYLFARYVFRGKSLLQALSGIPFVMPTLVVAAAFYALIGPRGWINLGLMSLFGLKYPPLELTNSLTAILLAHIFYNTTIILRMVGDFWSHLDPRLTQAGRTLGANRWQSFRRITLPLLLPAITSAALLVFIFDFTSFGVIMVLGGPRFATLEVEIYNQTVSLFNLPLAAILALLQLGCTLAMTIVYTQLSGRLTAPLRQKSQRYTQRRLTNWRNHLFAFVMITVLLVMLVSPLVALAARSVVRLEPERGQQALLNPGFTLDFYRTLFVNRQNSLFYTPPTTAIAISLTYAFFTMMLALVLGIPAAWSLASGTSPRLNRLLDPILMLPLGTSAVTLGLGFIVALNHPPLNLRTSPMLIPIAHTLVAFPFVVRSLTPSLRAIQPRLHQAAAVLGANPLRVFRYVDLPIASRAILAAAIFAFAISLGEFGATVLIARPEFPTVPILIFRFLSQPGALNFGQAMALSTILMVLTGAGMLLIERFRVAEIGEF